MGRYPRCAYHSSARSLSLHLSIASKRASRALLTGTAAPCAVAFAVGLIVLTLVTFVWLPRYDPVGGQMLGDTAFVSLRDARSPWTSLGNADGAEAVPGGVRLANDDDGKTVLVEQVVTLPTGVEGVRLTATVELDDVVRGRERWQKARLFVLGVKPEGRSDFSRSHRFLHATGTLGPSRWSDVFMLDPICNRVRVLIGLPRATGKLTVTGVELRGIALKPVFRLMRTITMAGWMVGALVLAGIIWRRSRNRLATTLALAAVAVVIAVATIPYDVRAPVQSFFGELGGDGVAGPLKLAMHFGVLAVLAIAARRLLPTLQWIRLWCGLVLAGLALELGEWFRGTLDRGDGLDFAANLGGVTLGLGLVFLGERWLALRQRSKPGTVGAPELPS